MTTELFEKIDQEYKKKKDFKDLNLEWLDKPDKEFETDDVEIEVVKEELPFPPIEDRTFFDESIPSFEQDKKTIKEIDQITIEKDE